MFNTYARICIDESDEDEAAAARLIAGGPAAPAVPTAVVVSTGASRSRTQQDMQQRRGTFTSSATATTPAPAGCGMGNLIDLADEAPEPRPRPTNTASTASANHGRQRAGRNHAPSSQPAVELVALSSQADPFLDLASATPFTTQRHQQQQALGGGAGGAAYAGAATALEGRQAQHPLDDLLGGELGDPSSGGRKASHSAASTSGAPARQQGPFPALGSFSDLLRGLGAGAGAYAGPGPGPAPSAGSNAWGSFAGGTPPGAAAAQGWGGGGGATHGSSAPSSSSLQRHVHSQSTNGIDDLLLAQRAMREAADASAGGGGGIVSSVSLAAVGPGTLHKPPGLQKAERQGGGDGGGGTGPDVFDPFGANSSGSSNSAPAPPSGAAAAAVHAGASSVSGTSGAPPPPAAARDASFVVGGGGGGGGEGFNMNQRELLLYAVPLFKDKLVFLPVVNWKDDEDTSTVLGKVSAGMSNVQLNISNMWHSLKDKGELSAKIYKAGQAILENMNAEERLMKNIPRKANKLVVHHPSALLPDEVQDQLTQLTSNFCYKSVGKAAMAGVMLPVAVGLEVLAVPGIGWYTAYQLFKSTSSAAGGSRLNNYLKSDKSEVRVCYAPNTKMDIYILKSRLSPDGVLGSEDIEDLCHDIREPALLHPLQELRQRYLRKTQTTKADYALLPMSAPDVDEQYGSGPKKDD